MYTCTSSMRCILTVTVVNTASIFTSEYRTNIPDFDYPLARELTHGHLQRVERKSTEKEKKQKWNQERTWNRKLSVILIY